MDYWFGVYGFEITRAATVAEATLFPIHADADHASKFSRDRLGLHFTAVGRVAAKQLEAAGLDIAALLYDLAGAMTLCEQQYVAITAPVRVTEQLGPDEAAGAIPPFLTHYRERPSPGTLILQDRFDPAVRPAMLTKCLKALRDQVRDQQTGFRSAFFRAVEIWCLPRQLVELTYFPAFSAIELLARRAAPDPAERNVPALITPYLQRLGFDVVQGPPSMDVRAIENYAHVRNAMFHHGRLSTIIKENDRLVVLELTRYADHLEMLLPYVLLRSIEYSDSYINWNCWLDRQPFTSKG